MLEPVPNRNSGDLEYTVGCEIPHFLKESL